MANPLPVARLRRVAPALLAEFLGTFALCFFGCGSVVVASMPETDGYAYGKLLTIALAHALVLVVFVTAMLPVSGAQFNPAVSLALFALNKQNLIKAASFIATQLFAAACGVGMLVLLIGEEPVRAATAGATIGTRTEAGDVLAVLGLEFFATFALMYAILMVIVDGRGKGWHNPIVGGLVVGGIVAVCILSIGPLTGASMNPARSFGPALYGYWAMHWAYWVGPITGSLAAALVYGVLGRVDPNRSI
ncbi:MAG: aquaporin [Planctomycetota bacterium]